MSTVQIKGWVHYSAPAYQGDPGFWSFFTFNAADQGYVCVGEHTIEYELPEGFNPVAAQVAALKTKIEVETASYQKRVASIREQLSKLQALEYTA